MQHKTTQLSLKSYLDLHQLLTTYRGSHEENRLFAISQKNQKPLALLLEWLQKNLYRITTSLDSNKYLHYLTLFSSLFGFLALMLGFLTGFALLSYSGSEPVNVIYLLLVMVGLPLLSMLLSLLSMLLGNIGVKIFSHFSPLYYLEKVVKYLPFAKNIEFSSLPFSTGLSKWIFLQRVQIFSFLFSLGLFLALILMIISKDIAFGWSTTLQVDAKSFQSLLSTLSLPWREFLPSAVPSLELVDLSHYFRLGKHLDTNMIHNADKLGAWWKFLAMATFTYALGLRLIFWLVTYYGLKQQLKKEFFSLDGVSTLIKEFQTPFVSTQSHKSEEHLDIKEQSVREVDEHLGEEYQGILGWNFSDEQLLLVKDSLEVKAKIREGVGGRNSFVDDKKIIDGLKGDVLVYVKAWEPPTMDFMDFLEDVLDNSLIKSVDIAPLGTVENHYKSNKEDIAVWLRKLESIDSNKWGVIDV